MQAQTLSVNFCTALSGIHSYNLVFHNALSLNLLVLVKCSEISEKFLLGEFKSDTCVPYATQFWAKYNFTIISMTFVGAEKSEHMKQKRIKMSNFSSQNAITLPTASSVLFN